MLAEQCHGRMVWVVLALGLVPWIRGCIGQGTRCGDSNPLLEHFRDEFAHMLPYAPKG